MSVELRNHTPLLFVIPTVPGGIDGPAMLSWAPLSSSTTNEPLLGAMDEIYSLLVTLDYPDALTGGLRRTTDNTRGILEKTRGDLTLALRQGYGLDLLDKDHDLDPLRADAEFPRLTEAARMLRTASAARIT